MHRLRQTTTTTLIYDYNIKNNALLMNIYNDNSISTMWIENMELIKVYVKINQRLDLNEIYEFRLSMIINRKLTLLSDEY